MNFNHFSTQAMIYLLVFAIVLGAITFTILDENKKTAQMHQERDVMLAEEADILPESQYATFIDPRTHTGTRKMRIMVHQDTGCQYAVGSDGGTGRFAFPLLNPDGTCLASGD